MTYRPLSLFNPDERFGSHAPPAIRFRHIARLLLVGMVAGIFVGLLVCIPAYGFTHSNFVSEAVFGISLYATLILGYHWTSQEQDWVDLRTRFLPVGREPLVFGALSAIGLMAFLALVRWTLLWAGVKFADVPSPLQLESWTQLPFALFFIVILGPACEELIFRGLLLDWLNQKIDVWAAALILSVIFSLLHVNPFSLGAVGWLAFAARLLLGMGASALTIRYHSLRPALMMHATFNAIVVFASVIDTR